METICAFSNEPGLGGGLIVLGVAKDETSLFQNYYIEGITNPDKLQLATNKMVNTILNKPLFHCFFQQAGIISNIKSIFHLDDTFLNGTITKTNNSI